MTDHLKRMLDQMRPLSAERVAMLWPMWRNDDVLHVYASNAIEGSTMTLAETRVVLEDGVTIGGKSLREHLEIIDGEQAYSLMLALAQDRAPVTEAVIRNIHRAVVGKSDIAGQWRDHPVYIRGSRHVPPNWAKVSELVEKLIIWYDRAKSNESPLVVAATLHFTLTHIHPFADGNGRTARLLGNLELIRNGYAPVLIEPTQRSEYFSILERCSLAGEPGIGDATEFIAYIVEQERNALKRYLKALEIAHGLPFAESTAEVGIDQG